MDVFTPPSLRVKVREDTPVHEPTNTPLKLGLPSEITDDAPMAEVK